MRIPARSSRSVTAPEGAPAGPDAAPASLTLATAPAADRARRASCGRPAAAAAGVADTVTISGRAYAFNHMSTYLSGATIKVREIPGLSATTDQNGDYALAVPDDTNVTPYIDPPDGYNEIDLQTFHTRGEDIENANFQTPADAEYAGSLRSSRSRSTSRRPPAAVRDRHHGFGAQRARGRLRDVPSADAARRSRGDVRGVAGARRSDLLQRVRDPGPVQDGDLRGRRASSGRRFRPAPTGSSPPARHPVRELPRHLRERPDRQREPALGRLRAQPAASGRSAPASSPPPSPAPTRRRRGTGAWSSRRSRAARRPA